MDVPRATLLFPLLLASGALLGQEPGPFPIQTREPPLADERPAARAGGWFDPDEDTDVRPADHVVPAGPANLPGGVLGGPVIVPAQYVGPTGTLPTPQVTLDVEGG